MELRFTTARFLSAGGPRRLIRRGDIVAVPDEIAERLIAHGDAEPVDVESAPDGDVETVTPAYDALTVEQLTALADERSVEVTGTGKNGNIVKGDLVAALTTADEPS